MDPIGLPKIVLQDRFMFSVKVYNLIQLFQLCKADGRLHFRHPEVHARDRACVASTWHSRIILVAVIMILAAKLKKRLVVRCHESPFTRYNGLLKVGAEKTRLR